MDALTGVPTEERKGALAAAKTSNLRSLRQFAWVGLLLLALQSVTGLYLNLYIDLPALSNPASVFALTPVLTLHVASALLLLVGGAFLLLYGWRTHVPRLRAISLGAFLSIVVAIQEGFAFVATQSPAFSFGMELGFLGAMVLCGTLLYLAEGTPPAPGSSEAPGAPPSTLSG